MACSVYENLRIRWKGLINDPNRPLVRNADREEEPAVAAYYDMAKHRLNCEVCRDEDLSLGILQIYIPK